VAILNKAHQRRVLYSIIALIIEQVTDAVSQWKSYAKEAGVSKESIDLIEKQLKGILKL
jgi:hypothetical protein